MGFKGFLRDFVGVDATQGNFSSTVAFSARRLETPVLELLHHLMQAGIAVLADFAFKAPQLTQGLCQTLGHVLRHQGAQFSLGSQLALLLQPGVQRQLRQQIDFDLIPCVPIGGDLQNGRTTEAAMSQQQVFTEAHAVTGHLDRLGNA